MAGITFDAGGLIALDRDDRRVLVLVARAAETGARITVPATALAQTIHQGSARPWHQCGHGGSMVMIGQVIGAPDRSMRLSVVSTAVWCRSAAAT